MMWNFSEIAANTVAIGEDGTEYTYNDLKTEGEKLAAIIDKRSLVFVLCKNEPGALLGYVTFLNNDIVPLMIDAGINRGLLDNLIGTYKPDYLWMPSGIDNMQDSVHIVSVWGYSLFKTKHNRTFVLHGELGLLLTTSGSTGSPKLVRQSYKNILANAKSIAEYLELDKTERPITTLPMSYTYGLSIINSHLYVGASLILTENTLMQRNFWQLLKNHGATSFGGVPYTYEMLNRLKFYRMDLPLLRTITQAGGKLAPELHKKFAEWANVTGKRFVVGYGQTEATARMAYLPHDKALEKTGSMGIAIPGGEFLLMDVCGIVITESNVVGELLYRGDNVTLGYAECGDDLAKGDEFKGELLTGDMAKRDDDGFYFIVGRKKRFLKIFGNRVNLDEIELMIKSEFKNLDCACSGIDDRMDVYITARGKEKDVISFLSKSTALNSIVFNVLFIEEIPRSDSGKIRYSSLGENA